MQVKKIFNYKIILLAMLFVVACCVNPQANTESNYMARAVLLEYSGGTYTVGALCQIPQASADSGNVTTAFALLVGEGDSLSDSFLKLEKDATSSISYKISDYVILCGQFPHAELTNYVHYLQDVKQGRTSAKISYTNATISALKTAFQKDSTQSSSFFETVAARSADAPRLYQAPEAILAMPFVFVDENDAIKPQNQLFCLAQQRVYLINEAQTACYALLTQKKESYDFALETQNIRLGHCVVSRGIAKDGVAHITIYAMLTGAEDSSPDAIMNMEKSLAEKCTQFLNRSAEIGWDVLGVSAWLANTGQDSVEKMMVEVKLLPLIGFS